MLSVYLDSIYNSLRDKGLTNDQIMDILTYEASKLDPSPPPATLEDYFYSKGLK